MARVALIISSLHQVLNLLLTPPLGLGYLAAMVEREGLKVQILDFSVWREENILRDLRKVFSRSPARFLGAAAIESLLKLPGRSRVAGSLFLTLSLLFSLSDLGIHHFQGQFQVYRKAAEWINQEIPKDKKVATYFGAYHSTRHFGFQNELVIRRAGDFSLPDLEKYDPDFLAVAESSIFQAERFKKSFQGYREVMQAISRDQKYRLVRSFREKGAWDYFAGIVYPELKGFRISIYKKE